jgi:hypothetical protein
VASKKKNSVEDKYVKAIMIGENTGTYGDFKGRNRVDYFTLDIYAGLIIFFTF